MAGYILKDQKVPAGFHQPRTLWVGKIVHLHSLRNLKTQPNIWKRQNLEKEYMWSRLMFGSDDDMAFFFGQWIKALNYVSFGAPEGC